MRARYYACARVAKPSGDVYHTGTLSPPLVSAIVVNLNGARFLGECLDSLFGQTWTPLEVILVDNASTDGSADEAKRRYGDRLRLIWNPRNQGFALANNQAIDAAAGEWVFLLNNDAILERVAIEEIMDFVADKPEVGMIACRVMVYDKPHVFDSTGLLLYPDGVCRPRGWQEKDIGQYDRTDEVLAPAGCASAWRRAMLDTIGLFDESYFAYLEDLDLGMRGQLAGWKCYYVPTAVARHAKSTTFGNHSKFKAYHVERNRIYNAVKLLPRFVLMMSPLFTLNRYLLQFYAARTRRGLSAQFMKDYSWAELCWVLAKAYTAGLVKLPEMLRKRRAISRTRKLSVEEWYALISRFKLDAIELALKY